MKIVEVEWVDSTHSFGWVSGADAITTVRSLDLRARTVGYLLDEDDEQISVVQSLSRFGEDGTPEDVDAIMTIPKVAITKRRNLK